MLATASSSSSGDPAKEFMTPNKKIKKSFKPLLFFLISMLLHLIVILFLLKQKNWYHLKKTTPILIMLNPDESLNQEEPLPKKEETPIKEEAKIKEEHELQPAKLSPRQSKFGVMWESESEVAPEEIPKPQDVQPETNSTQASPDKRNDINTTITNEQENKEELVIKAKTTKTLELKPIPREETILTANTDLSPSNESQSITTIVDELSDDQARELLKEFDTLEQKLKQTDEQKIKNADEPRKTPVQKIKSANTTSLLDRIKSAMAEEPTQQNTSAKSIPKKFSYLPTPTPSAQQQPKNKKKLIAMTQGFIENIKNTGSDWLEQDGVDRALTNDELKYISYEQQISWFLQASWKRHFANATHFTGRLNVRFLLDAQGNVSNVKIIQSSGNTILDDMVLKSIKIAAPFPPLPKYFEKTEYQVSRNIYVS